MGGKQNMTRKDKPLIIAQLHNIERLVQPIKIRQFYQKAQIKLQFGSQIVANLTTNLRQKSN